MNEISTVSFCRQLRKSMTRAEVLLWMRLRRNALDGIRFRRQHPIGLFVVDFACVKARLVIEVDGPSHWTDEGMAEDERRTQYLQQSGWRELRVCNDDIYRNLDNVIAEILNQVKR